jgi:hypothetical protein
MKIVGSILLFLSSAVFAAEERAYFSWTVPEYYLDGISLPPEHLWEYTMYYGTQSGLYEYQTTFPAYASDGVVYLPFSGVWYFAMTATVIDPLTSELSTSYLSNEVIRNLIEGRIKKPQIKKLRFVRKTRIR